MLSSALKHRMVLLTKNTHVLRLVYIWLILLTSLVKCLMVKQTHLGVKDPFVSNLLTGSVCCNYRSVSKGLRVSKRQAHLLNILHIYGSSSDTTLLYILPFKMLKKINVCQCLCIWFSWVIYLCFIIGAKCGIGRESW